MMRGNKVGCGVNAAPATAHRRDGLVPAHRRDEAERKRQRQRRTALRQRRRMRRRRRRVRGDMGGCSDNVATAWRLLTAHRRYGLVPVHRRVVPLPARQQYGPAQEEEKDDQEEEEKKGW